MSGVSGVGSTLTQQLYQKLFDRLNVDGGDALSLDEMAATGADQANVAKVFNALDADGDGRVVRAEMAPSDAFSADALGALIDAQADPESSSDEEFLARWFARADTDGDGLLNKAERQADADLSRAANYDAGHASNRVLMARPGAHGDVPLAIDQFQVLTGKSLNVDLSRIGFAEDLPPEMLERINAVRSHAGQEPLKGPLSQEERQRRLDQLKADMAERDSGPEGTRRFLSRDLERLRTEEAARIAAAPLSDALAVRMFSQIMDSWTVRPTPAVDTVA